MRQKIQPVVAAKNFSKWTKVFKTTAQVFRLIEIFRTKSKIALNIKDGQKRQEPPYPGITAELLLSLNRSSE